jgi:hypothetical protein
MLRAGIVLPVTTWPVGESLSVGGLAGSPAGWGDSNSAPPPDRFPGGRCVGTLSCGSLAPVATTGDRCSPPSAIPACTRLDRAAGHRPARVPGWLVEGLRLGSGMPAPSGQIPPSWAWWEIEAPTARAACSSAQVAGFAARSLLGSALFSLRASARPVDGGPCRLRNRQPQSVPLTVKYR